MDIETPGQGVIADLPRGCLARRAGYRDDFEAGLPAIFSGKIAESFYGIFNSEQTLVSELFTIELLAHDRADGTFSERIADIIVSIEVLAEYGKEAVPGLGGSRVDTYVGKAEVCSSRLSACFRFDTALYHLCQGTY